ncbi:MAG: hypothetical protein ACM3SR_02440 [Ignavibacteriales bacterium]
MKYASLFLILTVVLCSTGFDVDAYHSHTLMVDSRINHNEKSGSKFITNSCKSTEAANHEVCICGQALPIVSFTPDLSLKNIYSVIFDITTLKTNKVSGPPLSPTIKRKYHSTEVFLSNSSLLL